MPIIIIPSPPIARPIESIIKVITDTPARNFPFITVSLGIGCASSLLKEPLLTSPFIESNPRDKPTNGPRKEINATKEGIELPEVVNSLKNTNELFSCSTAELMPYAAAYMAEKPVITTSIRIIKNLLLLRWSAISFLYNTHKHLTSFSPLPLHKNIDCKYHPDLFRSALERSL